MKEEKSLYNSSVKYQISFSEGKEVYRKITTNVALFCLFMETHMRQRTMIAP